MIDAELRPFLLLRRPNAHQALPIARYETGFDVGARLCELADPGFHADSEWCVVWASSAAKARWPKPEPWGPAGGCENCVEGVVAVELGGVRMEEPCSECEQGRALPQP